MEEFNLQARQYHELQKRIEHHTQPTSHIHSSLTPTDLTTIKATFKSLLLEETAKITITFPIETAQTTGPTTKDSMHQTKVPPFKLSLSPTIVELILNPQKRPHTPFRYRLDTGDLFHGKSRCDLKQTAQFIKRSATILDLVHKKQTQNKFEFKPEYI